MSNPGGVLGAAKRVLYEAAFPYSYYGIALPGSATGDPVWTIVRSFTNAGITTLGSVSGVTWTGRVTHTYT